MKIGVVAPSETVAEAFLKSTRRTDVEWIVMVDRAAHNGRAAGGWTDGRALAPNALDGMVVCPGLEDFAAVVVSCAQARRSVLCLETCARGESGEWRRMVEACADMRVHLQVASIARHHPAARRLKGMVEEGMFGELHAAHIMWRAAWGGAYGGAQPTASAAAAVDLLRFILGEDMVTVYAQRSVRENGCGSACLLQGQCTSGAIVSASVAMQATPAPGLMRPGDVVMQLVGERMVAEFDLFAQCLQIKDSGAQTGHAVTAGSVSHYWGDDLSAAMFDDFVGCIMYGREPVSTGADALRAREIGEAASASCACGQPAAVRCATAEREGGNPDK